MAAPIPFPNVWPAEVQVTQLTAQAMNISETTFQQQVQDWGGRAFAISVRMQELTKKSGDAALMMEWLSAMDGLANRFSFDLDPWWLSDPLPGVRNFRFATGQLPSPTSKWGVVWSLEFSAIEAIDGGST
jgi:hypothetical protein